MKLLVATLIVLVLTAASDLKAVGIRIGAGAELSTKTELLSDDHVGVGSNFRLDFVWSSFTSTSLEWGFRRYKVDAISWMVDELELHEDEYIVIESRTEVCQRFFATRSGVRPFAGLALGFRENYRKILAPLNHEFNGGLAPLIGCEYRIADGTFAIEAFAKCQYIIEWDPLDLPNYFTVGLNMIYSVR